MTGPLRSPFAGLEHLPWQPRRSLQRRVLLTNLVVLGLVLLMGAFVLILVSLVRLHIAKESLFDLLGNSADNFIICSL